MITLKYAVNNNSIAAYINYGYAYVFAVLLVFLPIFWIYFYKKNFEEFHLVTKVNADDDTLRRMKDAKSASFHKTLGSRLHQQEKIEELYEEYYENEEVEERVVSILEGS